MVTDPAEDETPPEDGKKKKKKKSQLGGKMDTLFCLRPHDL